MKDEKLKRLLMMDDVKSLLMSKKAILFVPDELEVADASFFESHVFVMNSENDKQLISLNGYRAILKDNLYLLGKPPSEEELLDIWSKQDTQRNSLWDSIEHDASGIECKVLGKSVCHLNNKESFEYIIINKFINGRLFERKFPPRSSSKSPERRSREDSLLTLPNSLANYIPSLFGNKQSLRKLSTVRTDATPSNLTILPLNELMDDPCYAAFISMTKDTKSWRISMETTKFISTFLESKEPIFGLTKLLAEFLVKMSRIISQLIKDEQEMTKVSQGLLQHVHGSIFIKAIDSLACYRNHDLVLQHRISIMNLGGFSMEHVGLTADNQRLVKDGGFELLKFDLLKTPLLKIESIVRLHQLIVESQSEASKENPSADTLLPLLIYMVIKTNPPRLITNLQYISHFMFGVKQLMDTQLLDSNLNYGHWSYCFTNIYAAVSFVDAFDLTKLQVQQDLLSYCLTRLKLEPIAEQPMSPEQQSLSIQVGNAVVGAIGDLGLGVSSQVSKLGNSVLGLLQPTIKQPIQQELVTKKVTETAESSSGFPKPRINNA